MLDKLKVKVVQKHSTLVDTKFPPPFKQPAIGATTEDLKVNRDTSPPIRHPSYNHGPPPISRTQEQAVPPEEKPTPPSPPAAPAPTITIVELPADPGCRSFSTKTCHKVPVVVPKRVPYDECRAVPSVECFFVIKTVDDLECTPVR